MNKGISNLIESLHLLPSNSHLSHLLIRIERSWNDYYSRTLNTSRDVSTEEKDKASNKLKVLLLELIEALGEIQLSNGRPNSISSSSAELQNPGDLTSVTSKIDLSKLTAEVHDVIVELSKVVSLVLLPSKKFDDLEPFVLISRFLPTRRTTIKDP